MIGVSSMSLIACTSECVYQQDGYCRLERAGSRGMPCAADPCVNFVPRAGQHSSQDGRQRLPDISYPD